MSQQKQPARVQNLTEREEHYLRKLPVYRILAEADLSDESARKCPGLASRLRDAGMSNTDLENYWKRVSFIAENCQGRVLELGCGCGNITRYISQNHRVTRVCAVDTQPAYIDQLRSYSFGKVEPVCADVLTHKFYGKFDCGVIAELIEHLTLTEERKLVQKLRVVLERNATLIITTPIGFMPDPDHVRGFSRSEFHEHLKRYYGRTVKTADNGIQQFAVVSFQPSLAQQPRVSVVLPTHNHLQLLPNAVASVLGQTYEDFELIVVNDGSTDGTGEYLDSLKDPRVRVIHQDNRGLPEALNTGFRAARGELLTWISSDNYCVPVFLERFVSAVDANPDVGLAYSAFVRIDQRDQFLGVTRCPRMDYKKLLLSFPGMASFMYRRACQDKVGFYDPTLEGAEDWDMWLRIAEQFPILYVPDVLYYYRRHDQSLTATKSDLIFKSSLQAFENALNRLSLEKLYPSLRQSEDRPLARFDALFDFGTSILRSKFRAHTDAACRFLNRALSLLPDSVEATANLAVAYALCRQWEKVLPLVRSIIKQAHNPRALSICRCVLQAYETNDPQSLSSAPLFEPDKSNSELFKAAERKVYHRFCEPTVPSETSPLGSTPVGDSQGTASDCFLKAVDEFNRGNFEPAAEYMQKYRTTVDYSRFPRTIFRPPQAESVDISVIVVTYDRSDDLVKCLESVSKQDAAGCDFEVIVVDNGTGDIEDFRQYVDQYIRCPINLVLSEGRNVGACCAKGRILAFLDDDAVVPPDYVVSIKKAFDTYDIFAFRGKALPKNNPEANRDATGYDRGDKPFATFCDLEGNSAFLREVYLSLNGMDPLLFGHEGSDLTFRILQKYGDLNKVIYWPQTVIYHDAATGACVEAKRNRYRLMDKYLQLKHGRNIFGLRQTIQKHSLASRSPRFSFVMIVLNGMPFIKYSLMSIYDFAHEIVIVEGAVQSCMFAANPDGSSKDGTVEFIKSFADPHRKIRLIQGRWPEKCEMQNEALEHVTGDYVWLIDSDEVYKKEDLEKMGRILAHDPAITQVNFIPDNFWKSLDDIVVSAKFFEPANHYRRLFKYVAGARFTSHRPPTMVWPGSDETTEQMHLLDGRTVRQMGIILYHYNYISEKQVRQKNDYYTNLDKQTNRWGIHRRDWFQNCFLKWNPTNRSQIESEFPVWLGDNASHTRPFNGTHPRLMIDYAGKYDRAGRTYPPVPVMQNLIDAVNELKRTFPHEHLEVIETGTIRSFHAAGSSTFCISGALGSKGRLTSVDISPDSIRISKNFCCDASNIEWVESDSAAYLSTLKDKKFHLAFLDSVNDKDVIFREFGLVVPIMMPNSVVIIDDAGITPDGSSIDSTVAAQKGHEVWGFLKACGAKFDILPTPGFAGTQLKVPLNPNNLQLIRENIFALDAGTTISAGSQKTGKLGSSTCRISDAAPPSGTRSEQYPREGGDFTLPWTKPINKEKWKSFLSHDFGNASRKAVFEVLEKYLTEADRHHPLSFVEVGFGQAYDFASFLRPFHDEGKINYVGYDITDQFVNYAQQECPGYDFRKGGFLTLEKDSFDISYTRHTFEHLSPDLYESCLRNLLDATRRLCIITWFVPPAAKGRFHWSQSDGFEHTGAYVNTYAKERILQIVEEAGFDAQMIKPESNDEIYLLKRRKPQTIAITVSTPQSEPAVHFAYSGEPCDDNAIRAPRTITNKLFRFLQQRAHVKYYDWADKTTAPDVAAAGIVLGHPNPQPDTIIRRLFEKKCAGKYLIWPFHTGIPEINRYARGLAEIADKLLLICGPYWTETIDQTEYASWKDKIVRLDNAVDANVFPLLKHSFNPAGGRGLFVFGRSGPEKGTAKLFELLGKVDCPVVIAGDYSSDDLRIIKDRPKTHILGRIDWRNRQTATFILNHCDFFVNMSVSDASPTTLLESTALGLIPITTPQCGYYYDSFLLLSLSLENLNLRVLEHAQWLSENELKELQVKNRTIIEKQHNWEKFCQTVWQTIKPEEKIAVPVHALSADHLLTRTDGTKGKKILIVRSDSIGDFVIFGGAIPYYKKLYPDAHVAMVVSEPISPLAETCPYVDEVITFNRRRICSEPDYSAEFVNRIRDKKFDLVICPALSRDKVSEFIAINSGAPEKITCSGDTANLPAEAIRADNAHYTKIVPMTDGTALETVRNREFLRGLGIELEGAYAPAVWITTEDRRFAENLLSGRGIKDPIVIVPFAQLDIRNWPLHNWARLISMYPDIPVIICGVDKDKAAAEQMKKASNHPVVHNLCGLTTVRQLAAVIAEGRLCVSSESAAAHFAAVANRPHVVLVGGGHFGRFMPYSTQTHLVYNKMDCYNCNWKCKYGRDIRCVNSISVDQVSRAVDEALGRTEPQPTASVTKATAPLNTESAGEPQYLVSAIVSVYNCEKYIRGCLEDLENQTIADKLEIIVVNSGSKQNEEPVVREFEQKYNNITYIKTDNRETIYAAWNRAIKVARGKYLTSANTDDRHHRDAFEIMAQTLEQNPDAALVYADQIRTDTANETFESHHAAETLRRPEHSRQRLLLGCCVGSQPTWRKSLHDEFGLFDENLTCAGDWDFWLRISNRYRFIHIPEFLGLYYYNKEGIEHGRKIHSLYERYIVGKRYGTPYISVIPLCQSAANPLVSVVMPAYNAAAYIAQAVESVLIQNYRNFELVIVDDGSTDNTADIVRSFRDDEIRCFRKEHAGPAAARNFALQESKGDFVIPLDADDMIMPDFIAQHLREFDKHPDADLVYCDDCLINEHDKPVRLIERPEHADRGLLIRDLFRYGFPIVPFRTCVRKSVFDKIGFYDENLLIAEDYDMIRRFAKQGLTAHHLKAALYLRRLTPNSLSRCHRADAAASHFEVVRRFTETFTCDQLFPHVSWDKIEPNLRKLHVRCLAAATYLAIGQSYIQSNSPAFVEAALGLAGLELDQCLKMDPHNLQVRQLLQKCQSAQAALGLASLQTVG